MLILGIESSCDETGAAIIKAESKSKKVKLLSNSLATSLTLHAKSGGIIPENAAREQIKFIIPVIKEALSKANLTMNDIDKIAVTYGPGLIGSLLVGVETAKTLSFIYNKPLIPTNHLYGHFYANFIDEGDNRKINFPIIALVVSGGHTDLVLVKKHQDIKWLGGTRDDAAGEAMDKIGRLLGLPYPGGPNIEKAAKEGDLKKYNFPKPLIGSGDFDFSFSGLKTAVYREVHEKELSKKDVNDVAAGTQKAIIDVLVRKTIKAVQEYDAKSLLIGGGVIANQALRDALTNEVKEKTPNTKLFIPPKYLCTDNGAMIATAAFYNDKSFKYSEVDANPNLYF